MKNLNKNWLTEGLVDFEYKKYILLSYLQEVNRNFREIRLYPFLSDLVFHYQNLLSVKENKQLLYENFPKEISKADFKKLKLVYKEMIQDDSIMQEIEDILSYAIPEFKKNLEEGKDIYKYVEENMIISPVGLVPLRANEGYVFLIQANNKDTSVYEYQISIFESSNESYRGIHMNYLESFKKNLISTYENEKLAIIKRYKKLPNPATYLIESRVACPFNETLLPIAKRLLIKHIALNAA
jgi:hypothetical protein